MESMANITKLVCQASTKSALPQVNFHLIDFCENIFVSLGKIELTKYTKCSTTKKILIDIGVATYSLTVRIGFSCSHCYESSFSTYSVRRDWTSAAWILLTMGDKVICNLLVLDQRQSHSVGSWRAALLPVFRCQKINIPLYCYQSYYSRQCLIKPKHYKQLQV